MNFHIVTLFPEAFDSYLGESILKRAIEDRKIKVKFYNPRDFSPKSKGKKQTYADRRVDDRPYGGGPGMVLEALPVIKAIEKATKKLPATSYKLVWLSPGGKQFETKTAKKFAGFEHLIIVCGRYEGIDARVKKVFKFEDISVGPYVLTGGELPAMMIMDSVARQVEEVLGNFDSREEERVASSEVYTRPEVLEYRGKKYRVPKVLLSGHRAKIESWRLAKSSRRAR